MRDRVKVFCVDFNSEIIREISSRVRRGLVLVVQRYIPNQHGGAPVILLGAITFETGKKNNRIGANISSNEDTTTYDFLLKFVKEQAKTLPLALMADGAIAVSLSCKEILPECKR